MHSPTASTEPQVLFSKVARFPNVSSFQKGPGQRPIKTVGETLPGSLNEAQKEKERNCANILQPSPPNVTQAAETSLIHTLAATVTTPTKSFYSSLLTPTG